MTPLISVLIDTYNYGRFVEQAVDSVLGQDFPAEHVEILVVDDGSTDDTSERVKKYGGRVQYFCKPNGGQASAFNFGVARARGQIVAFLDADDYWLPGKLRRITAEFEKYPEAGLVYHRLLERGNDSEELREARFGFAAVSGSMANNVNVLMLYIAQPTSSLAFRRAVLQRLYPIPETIRLQADGYLALLAPLLAPIMGMPEFLGVYRVHGQNLYTAEGTEATRERAEQRIAMQELIGSEMEKWAVANGFNPAKPPISVLLERWRLHIDGQRLALSSPSSIEVLRYELRKARCWSLQFGFKLRAINYFNVFGAFVTGNQRFDVDAWRIKLIAKVKRSAG